MLAIVTSCSDPALGTILYVVKRILHLLQIIGPIMAIVSITWQFIRLTANPDDKKGLHKIRNSAIALVVLFIIPVVTDAAFALLDDSFVISDCWNNTTSTVIGKFVHIEEGKKENHYDVDIHDDSVEIIEPDLEEDYEDNQLDNNNQAAYKAVFLGDSRTVLMYAFLSNDWKGANYSEGGINTFDNNVFIAEKSMGLKWLKNTGIPIGKRYFKKDTAIIILMGVNDLDNYKKYVSYINENVHSWKSNGSRVYFVSANPCEGKHEYLNTKIEAFNSYLKSNLSSDVIFIDTYSYLLDDGYHTTDGLHYDKSTSRAIYNYIKSKV